MISIIKKAIKPLYLYFTSSKYRSFSNLFDKYHKTERFIAKKISFLKYSFNVPDVTSFIWQCKDIFIDEIFNFNT